MADNSITTNRVHFQSAGAVRRRASPPAFRTAREIAADIDDAYKHLIERLNANPPNQINPFNAADEDDLILRSGHLRRTLTAVADYVSACMRDTYDSTWSIQFDRKYLDGLFDDIIGDICGPIHNGAETLREERGEHAA
jgi:hypothetical protein